MAKATKIETVEIVLTISKEEAETLLAVLGRVGGWGRRAYSQAVYDALLTVTGLKDNVLGEHDLPKEQFLTFAETK